MNLKSVGIAAGLAAFVLVSQAHATTITFTLTGTAVSGFDRAGLFGAPTESFSGSSFTATETFNLSQASDQSTPSTAYLTGGTDLGGSPTFGTGNLTVGTVSLPVSGAGIADIFSITGEVGAAVGPSNSTYLTLSVIDPPLAKGIPTADETFTNASGFFASDASSRIDGVQLNLTDATLSIVVSNVPLPASLPMFATALLGLGAVGYALNRKRNLSVSA